MIWPRDINADVSTCITCGCTIFRTNMDGRWHHPPRDKPADGHAAEPSEEKPL